MAQQRPGREHGDAATYIDMMRHNISTIRNATLGQ